MHFGSLVSAAVGYLQALTHDGEWLLRIEDLDPPRQPPDAANRILHTLKVHGFQPSGEILFQSQRQPAYAAALAALADQGLLYRCGCSRQDIRAGARVGPCGPIYPGTCRLTPPPPETPATLRVRLPCESVGFEDRLQGPYALHLEQEHGDPVLRRREGFIAYILAVVVDDAWQNISEVVRGTDLLALTPAQIALQRLLGLPSPDYCHHPIATDALGRKLSKQTGATAIDDRQPGRNLTAVFRFLAMHPPATLARWPVASAWEWARSHWQPARLAGIEAAVAPRNMR